LTSLIRKISQTVGALTILGILSTSVASADQALTVAATTPATTASSTSPVSPAANTDNDVAQAGPLSDVPLNSWAYDAVNQLAKDGIIKGYPDGTFKGNRPMTRYEAAVLAYRAVDMLEAQITAGKAVEKADMDAANKLMAAFGNELKAVERHVDALQKQADATDKSLDATNKNLAGVKAVGDATAGLVRRQQLHLLMLFRDAAYGQNIQANAGPLPETFNGVTYGPGSALPGGIGTAPTGTSLTGSYAPPTGIVVPGQGVAGGVAWGNQPMYVMGQNGNTLGQYNHGLATQYMSASFGGNPDDRSQYLIKFTNLDRYSSVNYYPQETPSACTAATIGVAGAACSAANAGASNADGYLTNFMRLQDVWYQYTSPGGIYAKVGKFVMDEGPKQLGGTSWGLADYVNGARIGWRNQRFNAQIGYGFEDTAAQQALLYGLPFTSNVMYAQADVQLDPKGHTDIGGYYTNYNGFHQVLWDSTAILCQGTTPNVAGSPALPAGQAYRNTGKVLPLLAGQTYTAGGCGAGFAPISYGAPGGSAGLPVTGAYLSTGAGAQAPHTSGIGGFIVGNYGQLRVVFEGTAKLGNDPTTGVKWTNNLTGFFQADFGQYLQAPGARGKYSVEIGAWGAGFNGLQPSQNYYQSPNMWVQYSTDPSGYYMAYVGVKKFLTDTAFVGLFYNHMGLLPGAIIPAGSLQCPGCVISGDSRNAVFGELNLAF
jgi:guanyl-specific ribonuclease Sa